MVHLYGAILFDISTQAPRFRTVLNPPSHSAVFCARVSFHVISWFLYMTDALAHAAESRGVHCSWTPPAVRACYLNPCAKVAFLPFSWALTADPAWCCPHTEANATVKFSHSPNFFVKVFAHVWLCVCTYVLQTSLFTCRYTQKRKYESLSNFQALNTVQAGS